MNGFMKGMMQAGASQQKTGAAMMDQMNITVDAARDAQTEDEIKAIYAKTGAAVHGAMAGPLAPEKHGEGRMRGHVGDTFAVHVDRAPVV